MVGVTDFVSVGRAILVAVVILGVFVAMAVGVGVEVEVIVRVANSCIVARSVGVGVAIPVSIGGFCWIKMTTIKSIAAKPSAGNKADRYD